MPTTSTPSAASTAILRVAIVSLTPISDSAGDSAVSTLSNDGYAVHFVVEAYKHLKPIGAYGAGIRLMRAHIETRLAGHSGNVRSQEDQSCRVRRSRTKSYIRICARRATPKKGRADFQCGRRPGQVVGRPRGRQVRVLSGLDGSGIEEAGQRAWDCWVFKLDERQVGRQTAESLSPQLVRPSRSASTRNAAA